MCDHPFYHVETQYAGSGFVIAQTFVCDTCGERETIKLLTSDTVAAIQETIGIRGLGDQDREWEKIPPEPDDV